MTASSASMYFSAVSPTGPNMSRKEYWARPPRKFIGDERGGCATIFIDRYTISVIEKCEAYEAKRCRH